MKVRGYLKAKLCPAPKRQPRGGEKPEPCQDQARGLGGDRRRRLGRPWLENVLSPGDDHRADELHSALYAMRGLLGTLI